LGTQLITQLFMDDISVIVPKPCGKFVAVCKAFQSQTERAFCRSMTLREIQASCFIDSSALLLYNIRIRY